MFVQEPQLRGSYRNVLVAKCLPCLSFAGTFLGIRSLSFPTALGPASLPPQRLSLSQHHPVFSSWQTNSSSDPHALFRLPLSLVGSTGRSRWAPSPPWLEQVTVQNILEMAVERYNASEGNRLWGTYVPWPDRLQRACCQGWIVFANSKVFNFQSGFSVVM